MWRIVGEFAFFYSSVVINFWGIGCGICFVDSHHTSLGEFVENQCIVESDVGIKKRIDLAYELCTIFYISFEIFVDY